MLCPLVFSGQHLTYPCMYSRLAVGHSCLWTLEGRILSSTKMTPHGRPVHPQHWICSVACYSGWSRESCFWPFNGIVDIKYLLLFSSHMSLLPSYRVFIHRLFYWDCELSLALKSSLHLNVFVAQMTVSGTRFRWPWSLSYSVQFSLFPYWKETDSLGCVHRVCVTFQSVQTSFSLNTILKKKNESKVLVKFPLFKKSIFLGVEDCSALWYFIFIMGENGFDHGLLMHV